MFRTKYYLNPETLHFEKVRLFTRTRLRNGFISFIILAIITIIFRLTFDEKIESPKVIHFTQKNKDLKSAYENLNKKISYAENFLFDIQNRDDQVYRSVFDLAPIPENIREAGFGGSESYDDLNAGDTEFVINTAKKLDQLSTKARIQSISLTDLYRLAREKSKLNDHIPSIQPISPADHFWLTSTYGYRKDPFSGRRTMHHGIDLAGPYGLKIFSTGDGVVTKASYNRYGYGNEVIIDHGFGYVSIYAHLKEIRVETGQKVKRGQLVGLLGSTGKSTGPHLHYEIRKNDRAVNPMYYYFENLTALEYNSITSQINSDS